MYQKKTLRKMPPQTRKLAEALNDIEAGMRKVKRQLPVIQHMEMKAKALDEGTSKVEDAPPVDEHTEVEIKPTKQRKANIKNGVTPPNWEDL